jgi:dihydrofolate reductase
MFGYGYPNWGENPPFHAPVFVVTHRGGERIEKNGGTSYTFVTGGIKAAVEQARPWLSWRDGPGCPVADRTGPPSAPYQP